MKQTSPIQITPTTTPRSQLAPSDPWYDLQRFQQARTDVEREQAAAVIGERMRVVSAQMERVRGRYGR